MNSHLLKQDYVSKSLWGCRGNVTKIAFGEHHCHAPYGTPCFHQLAIHFYGTISQAILDTAKLVLGSTRQIFRNSYIDKIANTHADIVLETIIVDMETV